MVEVIEELKAAIHSHSLFTLEELKALKLPAWLLIHAREEKPGEGKYYIRGIEVKRP
jgi:hypothetical protein